MPRRKVVAKRKILPDPVYGNELLAKFINCVMADGKKSVAEQVVYGSLELLAKKASKKAQQDEGQEGGDSGKGGKSSSGASSSKALDIFSQALENIRPTVEVRSRRVGGATYQVPVEVRASRSFALAMRWLIQAARGRGEHGMVAQLAAELMDAFEQKGSAIKKRDDMHRMAKANQAFAHFRWT